MLSILYWSCTLGLLHSPNYIEFSSSYTIRQRQYRNKGKIENHSAVKTQNSNLVKLNNWTRKTKLLAKGLKLEWALPNYIYRKFCTKTHTQKVKQEQECPGGGGCSFGSSSGWSKGGTDAIYNTWGQTQIAKGKDTKLQRTRTGTRYQYLILS